MDKHIIYYFLISYIKIIHIASNDTVCNMWRCMPDSKIIKQNSPKNLERILCKVKMHNWAATKAQSNQIIITVPLDTFIEKEKYTGKIVTPFNNDKWVINIINARSQAVQPAMFFAQR